MASSCGLQLSRGLYPLGQADTARPWVVTEAEAEGPVAGPGTVSAAVAVVAARPGLRLPLRALAQGEPRYLPSSMLLIAVLLPFLVAFVAVLPWTGRS